jgi:hypothetical protein
MVGDRAGVPVAVPGGDCVSGAAPHAHRNIAISKKFTIDRRRTLMTTSLIKKSIYVDRQLSHKYSKNTELQPGRHGRPANTVKPQCQRVILCFRVVKPGIMSRN